MANTTSELDQYIQSTTKSKALWEDAKNYLPGGDSRNSIFWAPYPIFVDHASGCHVVDSDGTDRLDFIGTMTTLILGHGPKAVLDAVNAQMSQGLVYNAPNPHQVHLAKLLCQRIPSFDLVRFTNSGTEATLNTIRAARAVTGKSKIAKVEGGYHGSHDQVSVSVRVNPAKAGERSRPNAMAATEGLGEGTLGQVVVVPFNETAVAQEILEAHKDELAAVIIEPMLGSVGMLPATSEFLAMLREFTRANGIILIFDEVISYRAASGGAQEYYGIIPDMTSLGKIIGGGFSIGAFGGRKDIMDLYDPSAEGGPRVAHAGTFNANPVTMLAGAATLEQLTAEVYQSLAEMTEYLRAEILKVGTELETPIQVTGLGSLFGIHFTGDELLGYRDIAAEDSAFRHQVFLGMLNEGILMASNLVGAVSTEIGKSEIDAFTAALRRVLERTLTSAS
ncbi:aspartate aminotransferase family protein [SAR202 cluster bacterium AD-802-F09_MRT_200m]|nr:aspartate aminotransferase family protein [SAR202 cluster bacterium AD-802-F09_MRT_200m]